MKNWHSVNDAQKAIAVLRNTGRLVEPEHCEICGISKTELRKRYNKSWVDVFQAHHWKGYHEPLTVWWLCRSCHKRLRDNHIEHDGQHTLEQARQILRQNPARHPRP